VKRHYRLAVLLAMMCASMAVAASASAQVVVGQVAPPGTLSECAGYAEPFEEMQASVTSGASYVVPAPGGAITSWGTNAGPGAEQLLRFKVFRPVSVGKYRVVATDSRQLTESTLNVFPVSIPVQAGDIIGLNTPAEFEGAPTACKFETENLADFFLEEVGNTAVGGVTGFAGVFRGFRVNVSATVLPPPVVSGISGNEGSIAGGASVTLTGANLAEVRGVSFGKTPATSFVVNSEGQITAVAPASTKLESVQVSVTTAAGTDTAPRSFDYEGCKVPGLGGKKLPAAKTSLGGADCKLGTVKKQKVAKANRGRVVKQGIKAATILAPGAKIKVTVGR
jgi:hypothetical protein